MGYTTDFEGHLDLSKPLTPEQQEYFNAFVSTRRMKRDPKKLMEKYNGKYGLPATGKLLTNGKDAVTDLVEKNGEWVEKEQHETIYGVDGEFFAKDDDERDPSIIDYNTPPGQQEYGGTLGGMELYRENERRIKEGLCQPSLWCDWEIVGDRFQWNGGEKFYHYIEWLKYLIKNMFTPWGVLLNGEITWQGEESEDIGLIKVTNNEVEVYEGEKIYTKKLKS